MIVRTKTHPWFKNLVVLETDNSRNLINLEFQVRDNEIFEKIKSNALGELKNVRFYDKKNDNIEIELTIFREVKGEDSLGWLKRVGHMTTIGSKENLTVELCFDAETVVVNSSAAQLIIINDDGTHNPMIEHWID